MPLERGRVIGYDAGQMTFRMDDKANVVGCEISSAAMDELASIRGTMPAEREAQFLHLRGVIERIASDLFDEMPTPGGKVRVFYHRVRQRELR
jgi:Protein of unknown function (DUF1488)/Thiopurine S-methyltransferase (TPMT)